MCACVVVGYNGGPGARRVVCRNLSSLKEASEEYGVEEKKNCVKNARVYAENKNYYCTLFIDE